MKDDSVHLSPIQRLTARLDAILAKATTFDKPLTNDDFFHERLKQLAEQDVRDEWGRGDGKQ